MINEAAPSTNYPGNSHKAKAKAETEVSSEKTKPKVESVVTGKVVKRKKGLGRKFAETFTGDDAQSVGTYIFFDVIVPAAKAMISDAASQGVERLLFGESARGRTSRTGGRSGGSYTSYNKAYSPNREDRPSGPRQMSNRAQANHDFDEIILETRLEAEEVLDCMTDLIGKYDVATVADLYDLVDITGSFTDSKYGWTDLRGSSVSTIRGGFLLNLPKPTPIY